LKGVGLAEADRLACARVGRRWGSGQFHAAAARSGAGRRPVRCGVAAPEAVTSNLVWLPATEVNLAQLVAVVPDEFKTVVTDRS